MERYESIRQSVLDHTPWMPGVALIRYHGMLHGLTMLGAGITDVRLVQDPTIVNTAPGVCEASSALVRALASLVLRAQPEVHHVY